jgi:hypothetical protein
MTLRLRFDDLADAIEAHTREGEFACALLQAEQSDFVRVNGARNGFEQRGFTRAVGPKHGYEFARHHAQADALQGHGFAVRGAESVQFKHGRPGSTGFVCQYRLR